MFKVQFKIMVTFQNSLSPKKGVRQGCLLSCYLFILVFEILAIKVRTSNAIKGITLSKQAIKIS